MNMHKALGDIGEKLVADLFNYTLSTNPCDKEKDMLTSNGLKVEVKTQNRHAYKDMFTIVAPNGKRGLNNLNKCLSVDKLIFVEYDSSNTIKIWDCIDRDHEYFTTSKGKNMIGFPISEMVLLKTIKDKALADSMKSVSQAKLLV